MKLATTWSAVASNLRQCQVLAILSNTTKEDTRWLKVSVKISDIPITKVPVPTKVNQSRNSRSQRRDQRWLNVQMDSSAPPDQQDASPNVQTVCTPPTGKLDAPKWLPRPNTSLRSRRQMSNQLNHSHQCNCPLLSWMSLWTTEWTMVCVQVQLQALPPPPIQRSPNFLTLMLPGLADIPLTTIFSHSPPSLERKSAQMVFAGSF